MERLEKLTYYQPCGYNDIDKVVEYGVLPDELASFMVFRTREDCEKWLDDEGYDLTDWVILEYHGNDIEEPTFITADGEYEDGTNSVSCYNTEKELDEGYVRLLSLIESVMKETGWDKIKLFEPLPILYSFEYKDNHQHPKAFAVDDERLYTVEGETYYLSEISDVDDYDALENYVSDVYTYYKIKSENNE